MTDTELVEMAAKAAGYDATYTEWYDVDNGACAAFMVPNSGGWGKNVWNPLINDGDSLRLAVKLNINPMQYPIYTKEKHSALAVMHIDIENDESSFVTYQSCGGDPLAATRRAIVQCAAEIGKSK